MSSTESTAAGGAQPLSEVEHAQFSLRFASAEPILRGLARKSIAPDLRRKVDEADVVQEAAIRLIAAIEAGNRQLLADADQFAILGARVVQNVIRDQQLRHGRARRDLRREVHLGDVMPGPNEPSTASTVSPSRTCARQERAVAVRAAVDQLPELDREIVTGRAVDDHTFAHLGRSVHLSEDTVRRRFLSARGHLAACCRYLVDSLLGRDDRMRGAR